MTVIRREEEAAVAGVAAIVAICGGGGCCRCGVTSRQRQPGCGTSWKGGGGSYRCNGWRQ
ncbi:hypothetical protein E2562_024031 [Oryza meyeriana var. granulata]|uniref:Uncharacterized protein n=1 Tax=Oryza meyeriana var. granulata TaxID=110450 RepID=A0A6G1CSJ3_9ORYZ|nr:hypothetical protein E2562_024031 [Oryza meyeriana var. granulata]